MSGLIARIIIRYIAGALVAKGLLSAEDAYFINADPELVDLVTTTIGAGLMIATEWFYWLARKLGWER
ncbi:hypothetical protein [Chelativorans sp. AA-79]|uniref:hypothetical protein n=1 Tax=Chelativorans sp. AA-79 TaxID=3028735 RepID=UPI0023F72BBE|nr:hypothetical protein [Chelativorans sp. AA-79]WEX07361.1 hypothetical protein PVE73_14645 [Chelativorans sp. AA-79]